MSALNPWRRAYDRGRDDQRAADVAYLYAQADVHHGRVGDQRRRGAIRHAADRLRDGRATGRPEDMQEVTHG